jgi:hypothetical protein
MQPCKVVQTLIASGRQLHFDAPFVAPTRDAGNSARRFAPRDGRYDAMMFGLQTLGELSHGRPCAIRKASDLQHERVLEKRHAIAMDHFLAESQETTQLIAEGSERLEIGL